MFVVDKHGIPEPIFPVEHGPLPKKAILKPRHSLYVYRRLLAIEATIAQHIQNLGASFRLNDKERQSVDEVMADIASLDKESRDLFCKAVYLDTADRNSYSTIVQVWGKQSPNHIFNGASEIASFWKKSGVDWDKCEDELE